MCVTKEQPQLRDLAFVREQFIGQGLTFGIHRKYGRGYSIWRAALPGDPSEILQDPPPLKEFFVLYVEGRLEWDRCRKDES